MVMRCGPQRFCPVLKVCTRLCSLLHGLHGIRESKKPGQEGVEDWLRLAIEAADVGERLLEVGCSQRLRRLHAPTVARGLQCMPMGCSGLVRRQTPQQQ